MNHRPSILHRPLKKTTFNANTENLAKEIAEEQGYWTLKARLREENEERLRRSLYATQSDIEHNKKETLEVIQICEKEKHALLEKQKAEEDLWVKNTPKIEDGCDLTLRPWTVATSSLTPSAAVEARRRHTAEIDAENRRMIEAKTAQRKQTEGRDRQQVQEAVRSEVGWWNLGASSEKWIPPEYRVRVRGAHGTRLLDSQVPLAWESLGRPHPSLCNQGQGSGDAGAKDVTLQKAETCGEVDSHAAASAKDESAKYLWAWDAEPLTRSNTRAGTRRQI
eukprot:jgi/Botrbrau1/3918/Bobra.0183s0139.1